MRWLLLAATLAFSAAAQDPAPAPAPGGDDEQQLLERALAEAGNSAVDYARALEDHLSAFPESSRRDEIERILTQAAVDLNDSRRLLIYGARALDKGSRNPRLLEFVTRALLDREDPESAGRALHYATLLTSELTSLFDRLASGDGQAGAGLGRRALELDAQLARAHLFRARALGYLDRLPEAIEAARLGWERHPTAEAGRESARWLEKAGQPEAALHALAGAFALDDPASPGHSKVRERLDTLARAASATLPAALLAAHDRAAALLAARRARILAIDPNAFASGPDSFTLSALDGPPLALDSLKGKVVILDFWATWCGPCRAQHPLYEETKARFRDRDDVVFLNVSTDEDRDDVAPFLERHGWSRKVYFEDGLGAHLRVSSIPTTVILTKSGRVFSRMNGFIPDRFVDMLTARIQSALSED
jgi:thiol-disulfide isomerase/thioredoxin